MSDVRDNPQASRYELMTDGHLSIADYHLNGQRLGITHVEVPEALRGRGIAAQLMEGVVADAKAKGLTVVPICPYAISYLKKHPQ